mmetsp:Transcript_14316/g.25155  ORF Transcript_14316/g.25155 Transcript_14316/m.25155 type:complete len:120 (+) Transcript_14316:1790-2149(+)
MNVSRRPKETSPPSATVSLWSLRSDYRHRHLGTRSMKSCRKRGCIHQFEFGEQKWEMFSLWAGRVQCQRICRVIFQLLFGVGFRAGGRGVEVVMADERGEEGGQWEQFDNDQLGGEGEQ